MTDTPDRPPVTGWPDLLTVALTVDSAQRRELRLHLAGALAARACSGRLREAARWAAARQVPWDPLARGLRALGADCDCEAWEVLSRGCSW
ncbi:DUF2695 domain-containing protein [Pseudonocardia xishanensis]|uniref:DUF222 domain-containing protein n=1 Tax=Pseudonocardia xishanensis TaxID=630995 RepID=A0ABP8RQ60_9PSEU